MRRILKALNPTQVWILWFCRKACKLYSITVILANINTVLRFAFRFVIISISNHDKAWSI